MLPGLNFIIGLEGETSRTLEMNLAFLKQVMENNYLLRRINVRQVIPVRREFKQTITHSQFIKFKEKVREEIDRPMLMRLVPVGTVLTGIFTEMVEGSVTFGRQIGSYPLLVGIPYRLPLSKLVDVVVVEWGYRSITAVEYPLDVNHCPLSALSSLPNIGRKRAIRLFNARPMHGPDDLINALDDKEVADAILPYLEYS